MPGCPDLSPSLDSLTCFWSYADCTQDLRRAALDSCAGRSLQGRSLPASHCCCLQGWHRRKSRCVARRQSRCVAGSCHRSHSRCAQLSTCCTPVVHACALHLARSEHACSCLVRLARTCKEAWPAGVNAEQQAYATVAGVPVDLHSVRPPALYVYEHSVRPPALPRLGGCFAWRGSIRSSHRQLLLCIMRSRTGVVGVVVEDDVLWRGG